MNLAVMAALVLATPVPPLAGAGAAAECIRSSVPVSGLTAWAQPLDRVVSFRVSDLSLREALDRLAAVARIRVSYSSEALPLDRLVCVALDSVPVGEVLTSLLDGAGVEPVAAGADHVVLAPLPKATSTFPVFPPVVLDRIVVTGSPAGSAWKPLPVALDVVDGGALTGRTVGTLAEAFNSLVPGLWMWDPSPSSLMARYGSIRGTSSFGLSYPKVYIDGIQVANPLLFTRIAPETVERIEVIRGPQGAALYGADAISGVANIVMRHETVDAGAPRAQLRTGFGLASSAFGSNPSLGQDHVLTFSAGSNTRSFGLNFEGGGAGAFIPGAYRRKYGLSSTARAVGARSVATGTLRFHAEQAGTPVSPLLPPREPVTNVALAGAPAGQSAVQFTVGTNLKFSPTDRMTHTMVLGVDGYSLDGVMADDRLPIPSAADAALLAARGGADRATLHMGTVLRLSRGPAFSTDLSIVGEQSVLYQWTDSDPGPAVTGTSLWRNNSGASSQLNVGILDHLFLTGGVRVERTSDNDRVASLPMLGSSLVLGRGLVKVKLRAAYGKGIRWPETAVRETMWHQDRPSTSGPLVLSSSLTPEEQAGVEAGLDLLVGSALSLQFTRFDQTASGLIQRVLIQVDTVLRKPSGEQMTVRKAYYQMQNVGEITNRGWELQGSLGGGPVSLTGTLSLTDSRVRHTVMSYTGDLRDGDRMLDVPRLTMGGTFTWSTATFGASLTATRANDWIGYDRLKLVREFANVTREGTDFVGRRLRDYWMTYGGVTHLRATLTRSITPTLALSITGDNLLNHQRGEPDNITVLPGRTVTVGFRAEF